MFPMSARRKFSRTFSIPKKLSGLLPVIYDDRQGNTHLQSPPPLSRARPRGETAEAGRAEAAALQRRRGVPRRLRPTPSKKVPMPRRLSREGTDAMLVRAGVQPGQSIVVQESYDPAWQAWAGRTQVPVRKDAMDFMVLDAPPGDAHIRLEFVTPLENRVGRIVTHAHLALLLSLMAFFRALGALV
jgi:hypothetical protein